MGGGWQEGGGQDIYGMLLLLDFQHGAIFELPLDDVRLRARSFHLFRLVDFAPPGVEVLQFDQVPDVRELGGDDGGFG